MSSGSEATLSWTAVVAASMVCAAVSDRCVPDSAGSCGAMGQLLSWDENTAWSGYCSKSHTNETLSPAILCVLVPERGWRVYAELTVRQVRPRLASARRSQTLDALRHRKESTPELRRRREEGETVSGLADF
jgi:hypothetical protein